MDGRELRRAYQRLEPGMGAVIEIDLDDEIEAKGRLEAVRKGVASEALKVWPRFNGHRSRAGTR